MSQSKEIDLGGIHQERFYSVTVNRYIFRRDITGSQLIVIVSGEILLHPSQ